MDDRLVPSSEMSKFVGAYIDASTTGKHTILSISPDGEVIIHKQTNIPPAYIFEGTPT